MKLFKRVLKPLKIFKGFVEGDRIRIENSIGNALYVEKKDYCEKKILVMVVHKEHPTETTTLTEFINRKLTTEDGEEVLIKDCELDLEGVKDWDMIQFDGYSTKQVFIERNFSGN